SRVVEPANDGAASERRVREARALNRRIRRDERINAVDSLYRRTVLLRQHYGAFKASLFTHGPREDNFAFECRRRDSPRRQHEGRRTRAIVKCTRSETSAT